MEHEVRPDNKVQDIEKIKLVNLLKSVKMSNVILERDPCRSRLSQDTVARLVLPPPSIHQFSVKIFLDSASDAR